MAAETDTRTSQAAPTLSGDAEHVYVTDDDGRILSTHATLDAAKAALRCACRGTRRLNRSVIDGGSGQIACPWCPHV